MLYKDMVPERQPVYHACMMIGACTSRAVDYAKGYAEECRRMLRADDVDNAIVIQCRYILNNIQHWRGDEAKKARAALKAFVEAP